MCLLLGNMPIMKWNCLALRFVSLKISVRYGLYCVSGSLCEGLVRVLTGACLGRGIR